jgi:putative ABC transport system ATP-binding protein
MKNTVKIQPLAHMTNVSKVFINSNNYSTILKNVSFCIYPEEMVLLLGPSGSGKSTFLTILAGLQAPSEGYVNLFCNDLHTYSSEELQKLRARHIGFIFQTFLLIDALTALENILLVMRFSSAGSKYHLKRATDLLEQFGIGNLANSYPKTMSQGEKQRVAIARALANEAELLLADEPTGSLSTPEGLQVIKLLQDEAKLHGRGVVIVSHDQRIAQYADRVLYLQDGVITD